MAPPTGDHDVMLGAFVASAAKILAPNSLQFDDNDFERSPAEARQAATEAARLVQPGDLVFITTKGLLYSFGRYMTNNEYDHMAIALNETEVLHVGPPSVRVIQLQRLLLPQRQPVVLRVAMSEEERQKFLRCARQLIGCKYDVVRAYKLILRLSLKHHLRATPLQRLPFDMQSSSWICSDAVIVLLSGCASQFREALVKAKAESELDIFAHGSASLSDFTRIRQVQPAVMSRVVLPVMTYTANPHKRPFSAYAREFLDLFVRIKSGTMRWPLLEQSLGPKMREFADTVGPRDWPMEAKAKVLAYLIVLLVVMKRGATVSKVLMRATQLLLLRYVIQQVLEHMKLSDVARTMLARL